MPFDVATKQSVLNVCAARVESTNGIESKKACLMQWYGCIIYNLAGLFLPDLAYANQYEKPCNIALQINSLPNR